MYRFAVLFAILALASGRTTVEIENNLIDISNEVDLFEQKNTSVSNLFSLAHLTAVPSVGNVDNNIRCTIGKRIGNDRLVGHGADAKTWPTAQDVTLTLRYPSSGEGAVLTYAEIDIGQSSNIGNARVLTGGIGQRSITIVVKAGHTNYLSYSAYFYGL